MCLAGCGGHTESCIPPAPPALRKAASWQRRAAAVTAPCGSQLLARPALAPAAVSAAAVLGSQRSQPRLQRASFPWRSSELSAWDSMCHWNKWHHRNETPSSSGWARFAPIPGSGQQQAARRDPWWLHLSGEGVCVARVAHPSAGPSVSTGLRGLRAVREEVALYNTDIRPAETAESVECLDRAGWTRAGTESRTPGGDGEKRGEAGRAATLRAQPYRCNSVRLRRPQERGERLQPARTCLGG
ncbi:unnamed protein product [Coccothraustes coccothraustes]